MRSARSICTWGLQSRTQSARPGLGWVLHGVRGTTRCVFISVRRHKDLVTLRISHSPEHSAWHMVSPKQSAEDHPGNSSISEAPGSSHKRPERQSAISYDYAEEELMASIEQEYCR